MARRKPTNNPTTKKTSVETKKTPDDFSGLVTNTDFGLGDDRLYQLMTDTMTPFTTDAIPSAYLEIVKEVAPTDSAIDQMSHIASAANGALDFGADNRKAAELMSQVMKPADMSANTNAYMETVKGMVPPSGLIEQMTGVPAAVREVLDFNSQNRKFDELVAQAAMPVISDSIPNAYLETVKDIMSGNAIGQMSGVATAALKALDFSAENRKLTELIAQAAKPVSMESLSEWSSIFTEAQKPFSFPELGDLSTQLAAYTHYLDPSRFRTPALSEEVAKYLDVITPYSVLERPLGELYVTDGERELKKEISTLRNALSSKTQALKKKTEDVEAQASAVRQRDEMLRDAEQKEALLYILSRINQGAGKVLLASEALQGHFRDERPLEAYVMSVDIRRSTDLMLKARTAKAYAGFITGLCNLLKEIVIAHHGVFDKFTGDGILAFFPKFYTGEDAGFRAVLAAADCHAAFAAHYELHRNTFVAVAKRVGLGIGIDRGDVHLVQVADGLTVVGTPVVYACRMGATLANTTLLNQPAYEEIARKYSEHCVLVETEFEVKHEGPVVAYGVVANGKEFAFPDPAWKTFGQQGAHGV